MKVALFGGAFDPPHLGHQRVAVELISQNIVDEVRFVPANEHAFGKRMASNQHRLAMCELIINGQVKVETFELDNTGVSYSYKTLKSLTVSEPEHEFFWVIGSDNLTSFHKWGYYQQLLDEFTVYVYPRKEYPLESLRQGMVPLEKMSEIEVSSTLVRERLAAGESISKLVDPQVEEYIEKYKLYQ